MAMRAIDTGLLQFYDPNTGKPVGNGFVCTYDTVSGSPKVTYSSADGLVENPNPVPLDSTGSAYIFGEGSFKFVIKNAAGVVVRTIDNIGISVDSGYDVGLDTDLLSIGGGNSGYDSGDYIAIYSEDSPHELLGFGSIDNAVLQANIDNHNAAGDYDTVANVYNTASAAVPDGALVFDGPQSGYNPESTRLYEFRGEGNFAIDPQSDTNVSEWGEGDNYKDLIRFGAAEELREKRSIMAWDKCKNLIGQQDIEYPVAVVGSNGKIYVSSGTPTAAQMLETDPVLDTGHTVWSFMYDPSETASFPPWYRSHVRGIRYNNTTSIMIPAQAHKLLDVTATPGFTNDGKVLVDYYKTVTPFEFGAGTSVAPKGCFYSATPNAGTDWFNVYMIKTTGTDVDYCVAPDNISLQTTLLSLNSIPAEVTAGRTWAYGRRIAKLYIGTAPTSIREFNYSGDDIYTHKDSQPLSIGSTSDVSIACPKGHAIFVNGSIAGGSEDTITSLLISEVGGFAYSQIAYGKAGSNFVAHMGFGSSRVRTNAAGQISIVKSGNGSTYVYGYAWQDVYED